MKRGKGFTIIEILVTVTIMVILMTVVVVRLTDTQPDARDKERAIDIGAIAKGLEVYYQNGSPALNVPKGYYPGGSQTIDAKGTTPPYNEFLEGVSRTNLEAPGRNLTNSFGVNPAYASAPAGSNPDGSYSDLEARALLTSIPYLYQPLKRDNTFCASYLNCVKFNLYYLTEVDNVVHVIRSKNQ